MKNLRNGDHPNRYQENIRNGTHQDFTPFRIGKDCVYDNTYSCMLLLSGAFFHMIYSSVAGAKQEVQEVFHQTSKFD